ncbi:Lipid phosphate phosphatase delta [Capsicum baccatum]|uniref:Lipid phosphate phosphatase delta n=1 Tax=Capsicum baccatum TaxID=33114 RepID=A0A2G2X5C2_CAPBA|nr:Lipid phosphate phosphatase delta [Capsicum baccatum]
MEVTYPDEAKAVHWASQGCKSTQRAILVDAPDFSQSCDSGKPHDLSQLSDISNISSVNGIQFRDMSSSPAVAVVFQSQRHSGVRKSGETAETPWVLAFENFLSFKLTVLVMTHYTSRMGQKYHNKYLDALFSGLSCVVSVPFYTAFLPLLFWSGHCKLARQMTLLMAFCDYIGNCIKDVVCAPRPSSPPVRRITATEDEKENALEYGLPSSHTLNTVCLSGFLLQYILSYTQNDDAITGLSGLAIVCLFVFFIAVGRIYLGMHSLIDIIGGLIIGLAILASWLSVHKYIDDFVVLGQNGVNTVTCFEFLFS